MKEELNLHPNWAAMKNRFRNSGACNCEVRISSLKGAGYGVFATKSFRATKTFRDEETKIIMHYRGKKIIKKLDLPIDTTFIAEVINENGDTIYIDASDENSCLGRYLNDPRKDSLVNAKIVWSKTRNYAVVYASADINIGDEIFISYDDSHWIDR